MVCSLCLYSMYSLYLATVLCTYNLWMLNWASNHSGIIPTKLGEIYGKPEGSNQQISLHTRYFMLHFLIISHHNISLQCFSGQQKDIEKFCVRSFYSFSATTLLCSTVFSCGIFGKYQGGQWVDKLVELFYNPKHDCFWDHSFI